MEADKNGVILSTNSFAAFCTSGAVTRAETTATPMAPYRKKISILKQKQIKTVPFFITSWTLVTLIPPTATTGRCVLFTIFSKTSLSMPLLYMRYAYF